MQEFVIEGTGSEKLSEWLRTFIVDDQNRVYLACAIFDYERKVLLCMMYDNVKIIRSCGHIYAPAWWLIKEYPKHKAAIEIMQTRILQESAKQDLCQATQQ